MFKPIVDHDKLNTKIMKMVEQGKVLTENELANYIQVFQSNGMCSMTSDAIHDFTVIGFSIEENKSFLVRSKGANAVDALESVHGQLPVGAKLSVYQGRLPDSLKYRPDINEDEDED